MIAAIKRHVIRWRRRRASRLDWGRRHAKVFSLHPELRAARSKTAERAHLELWRPLRRDLSLATYRICANLSGIDDPRYVPEELFVSELQDFLYPNPYVRFLADKNVYDRWFGERGGGSAEGGGEGGGVSECRSNQTPAPRPLTPAPRSALRAPSPLPPAPPSALRPPPSEPPASQIFPPTFLRKIDGRLRDVDYRLIDPGSLAERLAALPYPVVCKPAVGSFGGRNVCFCQSATELTAALAGLPQAVVQQRLLAHPFLAQFGAHGLNTLRVYLYRSPTDDQFHLLNAALRMGVAGSLDNETAGGIVCAIDDDGQLNRYALDKYAGQYLSHPDTNLAFAGLAIPAFAAMKQVAGELAAQLFGTRLVGLDMCLDDAGRWRCIEINLGMQTIRFAQYAGQPFFGKFTEEVINAVMARR